MNSFSFTLILIAMGVAIYWYVMNIELSKDGNIGLFAMVEEIDDGEFVRMRELAKRATHTTRGTYAARIRHRLALLKRQDRAAMNDAKTTTVMPDIPAIVAASVPLQETPARPLTGITGAAPLAGVEDQPKSMRARVNLASPRNAREKIQEKMRLPNTISPDEEKAALKEYNRILKARNNRSLTEIAKGADHRKSTREANVFSARVKNSQLGKDDFFGSTRTPDRMLAKTTTSKSKYKKREKTSSAYYYTKPAAN